MKEIEVKILEVDKREVLSKLKKLGARKTFQGFIHALYFDFPNRRLKKRQSILRLRKMGSKTELTFKQGLSKKRAKIMEELQSPLPDFETAKDIMLQLGLGIARKVKKHRLSFVKGNTHFELDTYPGIPTLLEIESPSLTVLQKTVKKLGYSMKDTKPWSSFDVLRHYRR